MADRMKRTDAERMQTYRGRRRAAGLVDVHFWVRAADQQAAQKAMAALVERSQAVLDAANRAAARKARAERAATGRPLRAASRARAVNDTDETT